MKLNFFVLSVLLIQQAIFCDDSIWIGSGTFGSSDMTDSANWSSGL